MNKVIEDILTNKALRGIDEVKQAALSSAAADIWG
jgi:hypothetical protein